MNVRDHSVLKNCQQQRWYALMHNKCGPQKYRRQRQLTQTDARVSGYHWLRPLPRRAKYNDYRNKYEIEDDVKDFWEELVTAKEYKGGDKFQRRIDAALVYIKFRIIPSQIRFIWHLIWKSVQDRVWQAYKQYIVIGGAKLDAWLLEKGTNGRIKGKMSMIMARRRFHGEVTIKQDLFFRLQLLRGHYDEEEIFNKYVYVKPKPPFPISLYGEPF